jgi:hypothetical protein
MANSGDDSFDGFYAGYFTGSMGNSMGLFVFKDGIVVGADAGKGRYDGEYVLTDGGNYISAKINFQLPVGGSTITGMSAQAAPLAIEVPLRLPTKFSPQDVHRIETPIGPINAKFDKLRGF